MQIFQKVKKGGMSICVSCIHRKVCKGIDNQPCVECNQFLNEDKQPQTNADHIRAMSDEELAEHFARLIDEANSGSVIYSNESYDWLEWLQHPVKEDS